MWKRLLPVLVLLVLVIAAPLVLRRDTEVAQAGSGDDRVVIITPHNDSIRSEFGEAFATHWQNKTGRTIFIDWRAPGGGGEIKKLISGAFGAAEDLGKEGTEFDIFFGGGTKDFIDQAKLGRLAKLEVFETEPEWFGENRIPPGFSGETYHDPGHRWVGVCVSQFGIVYNRDAIRWIDVPPPQRWSDLGDPSYFGRLALADPTKSSSVTQAFEMLVQEQMQDVIRERGDSPAAREEGWRRGMNLLQRLGANARYFTDSASKIPLDVAMGDAAAGTCIDFYGRSFEDAVRRRDGSSRLHWVSPVGGTSVSVDSIAVFRGAPNMEIAQEFVRFCLSEEGQLLWNLKPGVEGGPKSRSLRRLPVRRDLYTPANLKNFTDPGALPYERTGEFVYQPELTGKAFDALRVIFRAMCMDPHDELKHAWKKLAVEGRGDPAPIFGTEGLGYAEVMDGLVPMLERDDPLEVSRAMTDLSKRFAAQYEAAANGKGGTP
ncbi:iron ABC transporter substrate-binding protein [Haloferula helveola]|uniref:Iron ABC transporter substrate-binding protein n=1 Tax=Haloferula helveola TaxID=490095 RepID=A0ABN6H8Y2_9BACT|nr:iron ABC transporter substrate-binding protein [Haloferula helveola]